MSIIETLINGILFGGTYSLVAIGFTLIFGVIHRLNIAHGATIMVSAYAGATISLLFGGDNYIVIFFSFCVSVFAGLLLGLLIERIAFRPLRSASYLAPFVTTIGVTIFLEELFLLISRKVPIFYPEYTPYPSPFEYLGFYVGQYYIRGVYIIIFLISLTLMIALHFWIKNSKTGRAMRIVEESSEIASLMGINVVRTEIIAFCVASALAGAAGCLIGISLGTISPFMASHLLLVSFVVIVMGGMGNMYGAMVGGLIVGAVEKVSISIWSSSYKEAVLFAILFLVLVFRPEGLFSKKYQQRD